ncbi:MAG: hypothetical protein Tsb0021_05220 [Chlamydiales bacterium]
MNIFSYIFLFTIVLLSPLSSMEKIVDTVKNVDLIVADKFNQKGEKIGVDYYALNRNQSQPAMVSVNVSKSNNVYEGLVSGRTILDPEKKTHLGWIVQIDSKEDGFWFVEWSVELDE